MAVELPADVRERSGDLGEGVQYALKVLCGQLKDDPLLGTPTGAPSLRVARVDGETFEDCPELNVYYAFGPPLPAEGRVRILRVEASQQLTAGPGRPDGGRVPEPRIEELEARQVTGAWLRIERWLREYAPASYASLQPGASAADIAGVEETLGVRAPAGLKALWRLRGGVRRTDGAGFLPENRALMGIASVVAVHRRQMLLQRHDAGDADFTTWKSSWIPFRSFGVDDHTSGLYLDSGTGQICHWSRYAERRPGYESLTTYLEEMADALEAPSLLTGSHPGLVGEALVWGPPAWPDPEAPWARFTG